VEAERGGRGRYRKANTKQERERETGRESEREEEKEREREGKREQATAREAGRGCSSGMDLGSSGSEGHVTSKQQAGAGSRFHGFDSVMEERCDGLLKLVAN